ncbi:hypothetical protein WJX74_002988 [Apatococcus lobatus]|uniref:Uncharacterized protein n=1 Tax=Apatococcus lobatus TaxID=904363 RepID=A0AAW1RI45_9CHLO
MAGRVYVGNLALSVTERDLEDEFSKYGYLRSVWVARKPPGFAFIEFEDMRDAEDAVRKTDGQHGWRVEFSRKGERGGGGGGGPRGYDRGGYGRGPPAASRELRCYECNEIGHLASDCRATGGRSARRPDEGRDRYRRDRSRSPARRRSPSYEAPRGGSRRSPSYASRSPPRRSRS